MPETLTVRELCTAVGAVVAEALPNEVWVTGTISGLKRSANGHVYFDLVDSSDDVGSNAEAVVPVALFASARHRVNAILRKSGAVRMTDGLEIRIRGRVTYYPAQSRIQLVMSLIDPSHTMGQLAVARHALLARLSTEGLLDTNAGRRFPVLPLRIGLITSDGSAALADFAHELARSRYAFVVTLYDARVQGVDAVGDLADGIDRAGRDDGVDVVVVIRGGGARSDLQPFDHEQVARAIATCPRPVVVGVGHEIDHSVADDVAHTSAKTPTAAAAVLVERVQAFEGAVAGAEERLAVAAAVGLDDAAARLAQGADRLTTLAADKLTTASHLLDGTGHRLVVEATAATSRHERRLDTAAMRLAERSGRAPERAEAYLDRAEIRLRALDPARTLARGWSIVHTGDGRLVRSADDVATGETLITTTGSGRVVSTVTETETASPTAADTTGDIEPDQP